MQLTQCALLVHMAMTVFVGGGGGGDSVPAGVFVVDSCVPLHGQPKLAYEISILQQLVN